jgi:CPA2 family monovalent cation:H+ antiporter-2
METNGPVIYSELLLLLGGAVVAAPIFKRLGLGTILGYLAAGVAIGPVARLVLDGDKLLHVSELGIVLLLFLIGLELRPARLWTMRRQIFGLGLAQLLLTGSIIAGGAMALFGMDLPGAVIAGAGLAMSSTAFAMQMLEERNAVASRYGQTAFSILLLQDIAIAPLLAIMPVLSPGQEAVETLDAASLAGAVGCVVILITAARFLLNPLFAVIAATGAREAMIAAALFVVLGAATIAEVGGLSMALGAFIAGVMLAESSFRHQLEADIEPFRGILLGLFFMSVGLELDLDVLRQKWLTLLLAVPALMIAKALVIYALCRLAGRSHNDAVRVAAVLPQGGEFGFVLFSTAASAAILKPEAASLLIAIITFSMALTSVAAMIGERLVQAAPADTMEEDFEGAGSDVLMIGFSRFGQIVSQILLSGDRRVTIIDHSARRVRAVEKFGFRIYFGDGRRKEVLEAAGIRQARLVAICTRGRETTDAIVELIQREFPDVKLFVRAYDRGHAVALRNKGVDYELRETVESALVFGCDTLTALGVDPDAARDVTREVRQRDAERLALQTAAAKGDGTLDPEPLRRPAHYARSADHLPDTTGEAPGN